MANITQTAANVGLTDNSDTTIQKVQYGEAITQGQPVYLKAADSKYYKADSNVTSAEADAKGIALTPGAADEYGVIVSGGWIDLGATLTVGETYVVSSTAGAIAPIADLTTGDFPTIIGVATTASKLLVDFYASGVAKP